MHNIICCEVLCANVNSEKLLIKTVYRQEYIIVDDNPNNRRRLFIGKRSVRFFEYWGFERTVERQLYSLIPKE